MPSGAMVPRNPPNRADRPRTLKLYDAIEALEILDELIEEHAALIEAHGGDIESVPAIAELLAFAEDQFQGAAQRWGLKIRSLLAEAEGAKVEQERIEAIVLRKTNAAARLKEYLKRHMEARDIRKIETPLVTMRIQANSQPSVRAVSETTIEELYVQGSEFIRRKEIFDLDREKILTAQAEGVALPDGIVVQKGTHLRVS